MNENEISKSADKTDYLNVVYDEAERPKTDYPAKLAGYLANRFGLKPGQSLLEIGCGRSEFLSGFRAQGLKCSGFDISPAAPGFAPGLDIRVGNLENGDIPFDANSFDVIYSKSLVEHLRDPERYFKEAFRLLKPGGLCLTLVPDWEANYRIYFDDFTHRTPFTTVSLTDIYKMCAFEQVKVEKFRQLPVVWKYPSLNLVCGIIAPVVPVRTKNKFLRWSREIMLLGQARKPLTKNVKK
jgi:SAM-dependent methyltransferase